MSSSSSPFIGKHAVIRTKYAGVHIGTVQSHNGTDIVLTDARRIWHWKGAFTLSAVATHGLDSKESKLSVVVPEIGLPESIEIIPTSEIARATFDASEACLERA